LEILKAQLVGDKFILSWPVPARVLNLEAKADLIDSNPWTVVSDVPALLTADYCVTNRISFGNRFYRLRGATRD
jgi:hypothetical protein